MWKNFVWRDRLQMTILRIHVACWIQTDTLNNYCFSVARMVARTRLNVSSYIACLAVYVIIQIISSSVLRLLLSHHFGYIYICK
jgi:hypothetical protein